MTGRLDAIVLSPLFLDKFNTLLKPRLRIVVKPVGNCTFADCDRFFKFTLLGQKHGIKLEC